MDQLAKHHHSQMPAAIHAAAEHQRWANLCSQHLPIEPANSTWKYSRPHRDGDLRQGWKLHIAATILSANTVLETVAPVLKGRGILFKGPSSLDELHKLNSGLHYGYCQVGKFITVYPRSLQEARLVALELDQLTHGLPAPAIPFDFRYSRGSSVFYRYGAFESLTMNVEDGIQMPALRNPEGELVPDARYAESARPDWVPPLFDDEEALEKSETDSPLTTTFRAFQSLAQRGKGGVYKAFDFSRYPPRLCILKEGRHSGETSWDGRDGKWLVKREEQVLRSLFQAGVPVPAVYDSFELNNNHYLVTEFIEGETLDEFLKKRRKRLRVDRALAYAAQIASLLAGIHSAGWAWRDCKPANLIVTKRGVLRPIDFEGAWSVNSPDSKLWSTWAFNPPGPQNLSGTQADLYAFGIVTYFLLTGRFPEETGEVRLKELRPNIPERVGMLLRELLLSNNRLDAATVLHELRLAFNEGKALHTS